MAIYRENDTKPEILRNIAGKMIIAARTAPKGKGINNLETLIIDGSDIEKLAIRMDEISQRPGTSAAFARDAANIRKADAMVLLGTKINTLGLSYCGLCGFKNCSEKQKHPDIPCSFNTGDLGIAVGSAVSVAMDARVDNRVMYTVGLAAKELEFLGPEVKIIYGIPLSASSKNIFFDRN